MALEEVGSGIVGMGGGVQEVCERGIEKNSGYGGDG